MPASLERTRKMKSLFLTLALSRLMTNGLDELYTAWVAVLEYAAPG